MLNNNKQQLANNYFFYSKNKNKVELIRKRLINNAYKYYKFIYPEWTQFTRKIEIENLAKHFSKDMKILEIGSGDGYVASFLNKKYGFNVIASDLEPRFPQYMKVLKVDGQSTFFQDKQYDVIYSVHVLEHIEDISQGLEEFGRLLKDDGVMYHLVPSPSTMAFTSLMQPISYFRLIYLYFNGYFYSKFQPFKCRNVLRFFYSFIKILNPLNIIWGQGHGIHNRLKCFRYWSINSWKLIFEKNNLEVITIESTKIAYSMHKIFPFKFFKIRRYLAKKGFGSANLFIIKKKKDV